MWGLRRVDGARKIPSLTVCLSKTSGETWFSCLLGKSTRSRHCSVTSRSEVMSLEGRDLLI